MKAMFFEFLNGMIKSATGGPTSPPVPMKAAPMKAAPMKISGT